MALKNQTNTILKSLKSKRAIFFIMFLLVFCIGIYFWYVMYGVRTPKNVSSKIDSYEDPELNFRQGKMLAAQHCQSCHMVPDPSLLDKNNWQAALAKMAPRLGIFSHKGQPYLIFTDIDQSFYPSEAAMNSYEWQKIIDYYTSTSFATLSPQKRKPTTYQLPFFSIELPSPLFYRNGNSASLIKIDTSVKPHRIFVHQAVSNTLFLLNEKLHVIDSINTNGPLVDIAFQDNEIVVCIIGNSLLGNNSKHGSLMRLQISKVGEMKIDEQPLFNTLARPVQITSADINGDRKRDYLICEFGNLNGALLWMENKGKGEYLRHDIRAVPGSTKAFVQDYNNDGKPDIWAQFAQGDEGIFLFTNKGQGVFEERQVIKLPPSYGSSSFELNDFNHDGFPDILYTAGDRGDGIEQLKPYHGVYVFLNNGRNEFNKQYFYPINGCIKAMARDFDNDGDLDIAAIGFFTDNRNPEEAFIFLKDNGNLDFEAYSLPLNIKFNRTLTMDIEDLDDDGKLDIILGNGFFGNKTTEDVKPLFIVLKNRF